MFGRDRLHLFVRRICGLSRPGTWAQGFPPELIYLMQLCGQVLCQGIRLLRPAARLFFRWRPWKELFAQSAAQSASTWLCHLRAARHDQERLRPQRSHCGKVHQRIDPEDRRIEIALPIPGSQPHERTRARQSQPACDLCRTQGAWQSNAGRRDNDNA